MANAVRSRSAQEVSVRVRRNWKQVTVRVRRNWKRLAIVAVALFIAVNVVRSVLPALGVKVPGPIASQPTPSTTQAKNLPPPTVDVNGVRVLGGGPLLTLDPGMIRPGTPVTIVGSGFDPGSKVDLVVSSGTGKNRKAVPMTTVTAGKDGSFYTNYSFPARGPTAGGATQEFTAQQRGASKKVAKAEGAMAAGAAGVAKLSSVVGKPGDTVSLSVQGFSPYEDLALYWGRISGPPNSTLKADSSGSLSKAPVKVGMSAVGTTSLVIVGQQSGATASLPFQVLKLYPSIKLAPYAVKAVQPIGFSGKGFVPNERVLIRLNSASGPPILAVPTDGSGSFRSGGFVVPFQLKGAQRLVFTGELSRATTTATFTVMPYMPMVRTSTYGGSPGTIISFYVSQFAPGEAVHVYAGTKGSQGELVTAFRTDARGAARAAGSYTIPGDASNTLTFTLVGARSGGVGTIAFKVDNSAGPVDVPPQPKYVLPPDLKQ